MKFSIRILIIISLILLAGAVMEASGNNDQKDESHIQDPDEFDWRIRSGTELSVMLNMHPWVEIIESALPEFERLTGIDVDFHTYPEDQFRAKRKIEMVSGVSDMDVFMIMPGYSLMLYEKSRWISPLDGFIDDGSLTSSDFHREDFFPAALEAGRRNGRLYAIPILMETSLLAYNKELFDAYGIENPPSTIEELEAISRKVYEHSDGEVYGITLRGKKASATSQWIDFLRAFGGDWIREGKSGMGSEAAVKATEYYGRLLRQYGPKSAPSNGWYESISIFMEGRAAMIYDASVFKLLYEDSSLSEIAGKVGYAPVPSGPAGRFPHISTWGLSISSQSDNKEAAWLLIQWLTNKSNALDSLLNGIPAARSSAWENEIFAGNDNTPQWTAASKDSYEKASPYWNPPVTDVAKFREAVGNAIVQSILGDDVRQACLAAEIITNHLLENE